MKRLYSGINLTIIEHLNLKYYIFPIHFLAIFNRFHFRVVHKKEIKPSKKKYDNLNIFLNIYG